METMMKHFLVVKMQYLVFEQFVMRKNWESDCMRLCNGFISLLDVFLFINKWFALTFLVSMYFIQSLNQRKLRV